MKTLLRTLSVVLLSVMLFTALVPCVSAIDMTNIFGTKDSALNSASSTEYTRDYTFNNPEKKAENDRILNEPGAWHSERTMSFIDAFTSLRTNTSMNNKFGTFSSLGTPHSSWTINTSDSNYASIPSITQDHPRLLVTSDTIPTVRKALEEHTTTNDRFFELLDTSLEDVNSFKLDSIATIEAAGGFGTDSANPTYDGRAGKHNYRKDYLELIQIKALGYLVDGHELYGYQAIHGIKQYLNSLDVTNSSYYIKSNMEREHGNVAFTAALVFDWCYPLLNDVDKAQIMAAVQNITLKGTMPGNGDAKMHCGYPPFSNGTAGAVAGHGSEREILRDYLSVAVAFYGESGAKNISKATANSWWTYISTLVYSQYVPVRNYYFRSGVAPQGLGVYVSGRHISDMYSAWILLTATGTQPYDKIDTTVRNFLGWETQPNFLFSDGDGNYVGKQIGEQNTYELRSLAYMTAYLFNDEAMLTQARTMPDNNSRASDPYYKGVYGADTIELTSAMYVALTGMSDMTYNPNKDKYEGMPLIQYNGSPLGQYVTHEAYGVNDSASVYMRIKERYTANHEHLDAGTFMIYYKGMLTADTGVYASYGGAHQRYYHTATVSHNGLLIFDESKYDSTSTDNAVKWYSGGQQFKNTPASYSELKSANWKAGNVVGHRHAYTDSTSTQPLYAYVAGNITPSYDSETVSHVGRRMLTVYTGDENVPMVFFTYDSITAKDASYQQKYLLQIPSSQKPTSAVVTTNGSDYKTIKTENGGGQLVLTCINGNLTHKGCSGYSVNGVQNTATDLGAWGHIELLLPKVESNNLLNAMYVTDAGTSTYYPSEKITNSSKGNITSGAIDLDGCVFNNSVAAIFAKKELTSSSDFVNSTMSFTAPGSGELSYYIDGLQGGNWNVKITSDGKTFSTTAKASNGLLTFDAPAGDVVLTKESSELSTLKSELLTALGSMISNSDSTYTAESYTAYTEAYNALVAKINNATTIAEANAINVATEKAAAEAKLLSVIDAKKAELKSLLGTKISNSSNKYSSTSYSAYSTAYDSILSSINSATTIAKLNAIDVATLKAEAEAKLITAVDEKKTALKAALGSKKTNTGYTTESYSAYSNEYNSILSSINNATTMTQLNAIDVATLKAAAEALLRTEDTNVDTDTITSAGGSASKDVTLTYEDTVSTETVYSVDVTWTDLNFSYSAGEAQWDPEAHDYTSDVINNAGWTDSKGYVTVKNHSNAQVSINITFNQASTPNGTATLTVSNSSYTLASAEGTDFSAAPSKESTITAKGVPTSNATIGKLTITVNKVS